MKYLDLSGEVAEAKELTKTGILPEEGESIVELIGVL